VRRVVVLCVVLVFLAGFAYLTLRSIAEGGFTLASLLSLFILVLLGVGVIGALLHPRE
jgi:hypothetical protein